MLSPDRCMFCGLEPDNEEHVMPLWLQRRYGLQTQKLILPNSTNLQYRRVKIPVQTEHNAKFSKIEKKVSEGTADLSEIYLWALKIHVGLLYRDATLLTDRSIPTSRTIVDITDFGFQIALFRRLYATWVRGGTINPSPFGSVFVLDSLLEGNAFDFFHCFGTGTIGINLGSRFIVVFLWDQGRGNKAHLLREWTDCHCQAIADLGDHADRESHAYMAQHVWACESAYWLYRRRRPFNLIATPETMTLCPPIITAPPRPEDPSEFVQICRSFNLHLRLFNAEGANVYGHLHT